MGRGREGMVKEGVAGREAVRGGCVSLPMFTPHSLSPIVLKVMQGMYQSLTRVSISKNLEKK